MTDRAVTESAQLRKATGSDEARADARKAEVFRSYHDPPFAAITMKTTRYYNRYRVASMYQNMA